MLPATKVLIECSTRLERFQFSLSITIKAHINKAVRKTNKPVNKYKYHYIADDIILDIPKTYFIGVAVHGRRKVRLSTVPTYAHTIFFLYLLNICF